MAPNGTDSNVTAGADPSFRQELLQSIDLDALVGWFAAFAWFLVVVLAAYFLGRGLRRIYHSLRKSAPTSGQLLMGKVLVLFAVLAGAWIGLTAFYDVNPVNLIATLGVVSLALGFGLQNTVANLAAGVSMTADKPFDVGDRIRVGQTWGDVVSLGLRSTRIRTTSGEHVVVPNSILDTQEVWNYTHATDRLFRVEVPVGISYDSSIELAEHLALQVARGTPGVVTFPAPVVRYRGFGNSSVDMEVRCWIEDAQDKPRVVDAIVRGVKRLFDAQGVVFPFPQRMVSYLKEQEPPAATPEHLEGESSTKPVALACLRGQVTPDDAKRLVQLVKQLDVRLEVLHVRPRAEKMQERMADNVVDRVLKLAGQEGVPASGTTAIGPFADATAQAARQVGARLVLISKQRRHRLSTPWSHGDLQEVRRKADVPVVVLDPATPLDASFIEKWHGHLHSPGDAQEEAGLSK